MGCYFNVDNFNILVSVVFMDYLNTQVFHLRVNSQKKNV